MKKHNLTLILFTMGACVTLCTSILTAGTIDPASRFIYPEYGQKISMDFKEANLNDILKIFSQQSGMNFIASQSIASKEVTLYLDNVPVDVALERILKANDLTYEVQPGTDIFIVKELIKSDELWTRVYVLKNASVASAKILSTVKLDIDEAGDSTSEDASEEETGIIEAVKAILTNRGSVVEDPRTNSLIITDIPTQFPIIESTIARLDEPAPQILIEVEMLDISENTAEEIGIQHGDTPLVFTGANRNTFYPFKQAEIIREGRGTIAPEFTAGTLEADGLQMTLNFIRSQSDTKNLARPKILTLNNQAAEIKISTDEAIGVVTTSSGEGGGATTSSEAERVETGVFLTVTPQINTETREITLAVIPRVIEATVGATFGATTFRDPEERGSKSILRIKDGETVVIAGLLKDDFSNTKTQIPFLADIPIVGAMFRHKDQSATARELIIFITPHIVDDVPAIGRKDVSNYNIVNREQDIPSSKVSEINKALAVFERKKL